MDPVLESTLLAVPVHDAGSHGVSGVAKLSAKIWAREVRLAGTTPRAAVVVIHPTSNFLGHYVLEPLAAAGVGAIGMTTRYLANDSSLLMENCAVDIGAVVAYLRDRGYERVILVGNSGGGCLVPFYQAQAESPTVVGSPGGGGPDLTQAGLPPVEGVILLNAHPSRPLLLSEYIDPAITDEARPFVRDPELDLFSDDRQPPYSADFIAVYREAQIRRMERITDWVWDQLDHLDEIQKGLTNLPFIVQGTVADPRFIDVTLDPSDRAVGSLFGDDSAAANYQPAALGRYTSLRSWLSQWSLKDCQADARTDLAKISVPALLIYSMADQSVFPSHADAMWNAISSKEKTRVDIRHGTHYFAGQPEQMKEAIDAIVTWLSSSERAIL